MSELQAILKKAIEGIDTVVTAPECTDISAEELTTMKHLQEVLGNAIQGIDAVTTAPECTDSPK